MISVALCTYNGERYIREQLESILNQTMKVDEIVVCDDGSEDHTVEIIEELRCKTNVPILLSQNTVNIGFRENFIKALYKCEGDLVFLSDQDDIWLPNKVETIVSWFEGNSDRSVVFTDATLINECGDRVTGTIWERYGFDKKKRKYFDHGFGLDIWAWCNRATGATMAIKKNILNVIDWNIGDGVFHDKTIALQALLSKELGYIEKPLLYYRIHDCQACGAVDLPKVLYYSPLAPCKKEFLDFDINCLPEKNRSHVEFVFFRASSKYNWFGLSLFISVPLYIRNYKTWAYKFFCYDLYVSIRHSLKRVLNLVY